MIATENQIVAKEIARVRPCDIVFIVGSGVSYAPPSGLPKGSDLRRQLISEMINQAGSLLDPAEVAQFRRAIQGCSISDGVGADALVYGVPFEGLLDIFRQLFPDGASRASSS